MDRDAFDRTAGAASPSSSRMADEAADSARVRRRRKGAEYAVICDLPDPLPVSEAELELLERELASFIDSLLRG